MRILIRAGKQNWISVCSYCGRQYDEKYDPMGDKLPTEYFDDVKSKGGDVSHGLCSECAPKIMGQERWEKVKERMSLGK